MPNTLVHMGLNGLLTRSITNKTDLLLIYIGSIIPDLPWIFQRLIPELLPNINRYDLRIYCVVLASFFFSIILSMAIAYMLKERKLVFALFSVGSFLHLITDSLETKWGNGVHLFAPIDWKLLNLGLLWPESFMIYFFTGFGLLFVIYYWNRTISSKIFTQFRDIKNLPTALIIFFIYLFLPFLFLNSAESADNHFVKTLREEKSRAGKYFEIDRGYLIDSKDQDILRTPFDEELKITNLNLPVSCSISVCGIFINKKEIRIVEYHIHSNRDFFTYIGLVLLLILLIIPTFKTYRMKLQSLS